MIPNVEKLQERVTETLKTAKKAEEARFERHLLSTETLKDLVGEMKDECLC